VKSKKTKTIRYWYQSIDKHIKDLTLKISIFFRLVVQFTVNDAEQILSQLGRNHNYTHLVFKININISKSVDVTSRNLYASWKLIFDEDFKRFYLFVALKIHFLVLKMSFCWIKLYFVGINCILLD
jgi:hypothetical protein